MVYRTVREEVTALIAELPLGTEFKTADIYLVCRNYNATLGSIGYAIKVNPRVECIGEDAKHVNIWKVVA